MRPFRTYYGANLRSRLKYRLGMTMTPHYRLFVQAGTAGELRALWTMRRRFN